MTYPGEPLLTVNDLCKDFPVRNVLGIRTGRVRAVDGVNLSIARGQTLGLVGESGSGKSTVGRLVLDLIKPTSGTVRLDGIEVSSLSRRQIQQFRRRVQIVFQDPYASLHPRMTVKALLSEPLRLHRQLRGRELEVAIDQLLEDVGLAPHHASRYPHQFSGGQRQRIGIARALATGAELIICDEPVSALDVSVQAQIINLLKAIQERRQVSYLFIAHDLAVVRHISHKVAVMYLGRIVEIGDTEAIFSSPRHPYTRALLDAIPRADPINTAGPRTIVAGDPPSPMNRPSGCAFHSRCPHAQEICRAEVPTLRSLQAGHASACHFAESVPPYDVPADPPISNRVKELMSAFDDRSDAANASKLEVGQGVENGHEIHVS